MTDYARLSLAEIRVQLAQVAEAVKADFGGLDASTLNWRPDPERWSVAQCLEHLLTTNRHMFASAVRALDGSQARNVWQQVPLFPRVWGTLLIRSQAPSGTRRFVAPSLARPAASDIAPAVVGLLVDQHRAAADVLATVSDTRVRQTLMTSPFARVITYSVLDGWRLVVAHDWRHIEQARRMLASGAGQQ
jgi:hypothetical protein